MAALNDLSTYGGEEYDALVQSQAKLLCSMLNTYSSEIERLRTNVEYDLEQTEVPRVNEILTELAELNKDIRIAQACNQPQMELQDQRKPAAGRAKPVYGGQGHLLHLRTQPQRAGFPAGDPGRGRHPPYLMENSDHGTLSVGTGQRGKTLTLHNATAPQAMSPTFPPACLRACWICSTRPGRSTAATPGASAITSRCWTCWQTSWPPSSTRPTGPPTPPTTAPGQR